jgi:hypothetical protein
MAHCNRYHTSHRSTSRSKYLKLVLDSVVLNGEWRRVKDPYVDADGQRKRAIHVVEQDRALNTAFWTEVKTKIQEFTSGDPKGRQLYLEIADLKLLNCQRRKYLPSLRFTFP